MKRLLLRARKTLGWCLLSCVPLAVNGALVEREFAVSSETQLEASEPVRLVLPEALTGKTRQGLADLRFLDEQGAEVPYLPLQDSGPNRRPVLQFNARTESNGLVVEFSAPADEPYQRLELQVAGGEFVASASLETSADQQDWSPIGGNLLLFRLGDAESTSVDLPGNTRRHFRLTLHTQQGAAVPTGAVLVPSRSAPSGDRLAVSAYSLRHYEGETELEVTLAAGRQVVDAIEIETPNQTFSRSVQVAQLAWQDGVLQPQGQMEGVIYRLRLPSLPVGGDQEKTRVRCDLELTGNRFLITVKNGDSAPLEITGLKVFVRPVEVVVAPSRPGRLRALAGNADATIPRYDLAAFASTLRELPSRTVPWTELLQNPDYRPRDVLAGIKLVGAELDVSSWRHQRSIRIETAGNQRLSVEPWLLAQARADLADLRLVKDGRQVPFLLERTQRVLPLVVRLEAQVEDGKSRRSRWQLRPEIAGMIGRTLVVKASTPYFQRQVTLREATRNTRGDEISHLVATSLWTRSLGSPSDELVLTLPSRHLEGELWLEIENGDNPPLVLASARLTYGVSRIWFRTDDTRDVSAVYGHPGATAPRYDLHVLGTVILGRNSHDAAWGEGSDHPAPRRDPWFKSSLTQALFWGVLGLVVLVLLYVVARLLPKPGQS